MYIRNNIWIKCRKRGRRKRAQEAGAQEASKKGSVDFYWDPVCPWCWITSRWVDEVAGKKGFRVNWRFFSLKKINRDRIIQKGFEIVQMIGLRALRLAAAARMDYGNDGVGRIYRAMGTRYHHDQEDIDERESVEGILNDCGFDSRLAEAVDDEGWDKVIDEDMAQATDKAGNDVGVPLIVLDDGQGPAFFGPVISPAPTGQAALDFWDAITIACRTPGFFEIKRKRNVGPIFGKRPDV